MHSDPLLRVAHTLSQRDPTWTMADLARRAGISRATLYRRYASRDAVLDALAAAGSAPKGVRERALDALARVAGRVGPAGVTMEAVAADAGCSVATLYRTFGTRDDLLTAFAETRSPLATVIDLQGDPSLAVRDALVAVAERVLTHASEQRHLLPVAFSPDPEATPLTAHLRDLERRGRTALTSFFAARRASGEVRGEPDLLTSTFLGMVLARVLLTPATMDASEQAPAIVDLFLYGCAPTDRSA